MNSSAIGVLALLLMQRPSGAQSGAHAWDFEGHAADKPPQGFSFARTGEGRSGRWVIRPQAGAPSGKQVLVQLDVDDTDYRFPVAVAAAPSLKDLRLTVKCRSTAGKVDQVCGLVFRYTDENNYYVARTNALENNVRLYRVKDGRRVQFAGWNGKVPKDVWLDLAAEVEADRFRIFFNGKKVIEATDATFAGAGRVGVWTKADSLTLFDDLVVTPLP